MLQLSRFLLSGAVVLGAGGPAALVAASAPEASSDVNTTLLETVQGLFDDAWHGRTAPAPELWIDEGASRQGLLESWSSIRDFGRVSAVAL